jgi:hypothetical protein
MATSGTPDGSGQVNGLNYTFANLFWKTWNELGYSYPNSVNLCYAFELMTPYNRVVVRHKEPRIILHGCRRLSDFIEENPIVIAYQNKWECVKIHNFTSIDEIQEATKHMDPMAEEGVVICDHQYNRCKIKSPAYISVAHMKDGFTTRRMLEIVRTNEGSEFLQYYSEYADLYHEIRYKYERLLGQIEGFYNAIKDIENQKQFALKAITQKFSGLLFGVRNGKFKDFKQALSEINLNQLEEWLEIKFKEF